MGLSLALYLVNTQRLFKPDQAKDDFKPMILSMGKVNTIPEAGSFSGSQISSMMSMHVSTFVDGIAARMMELSCMEPGKLPRRSANIGT